MNDFTSGRVWCSITNCPISRRTDCEFYCIYGESSTKALELNYYSIKQQRLYLPA